MIRSRHIAAAITLTLALTGGGCSAQTEDDAESGTGAVTQGEDIPPPNTKEIKDLSAADRKEIATKKATCPFVGAIATLENFPILNSRGNPLARVSDIAAFGNKAGGDLGKIVLTFFAKGNQKRMHGITRDGKAYTKELNEEVPDGTFSLDFPQSKGAHAGHSGILIQGRTKAEYQGGFSNAAWTRLLAKAEVKNGKKVISRRAIGEYIWENAKRDPEAKYIRNGFIAALFNDVGDLIRNPDFETLAQLTGTNDIVGSAGEFGLLVVLLGNDIGDETYVSVADMQLMFVDKKLPAGWENRKLESTAWVKHTTKILVAAELARFRDR
jgi:hypothetical protein